MSRFASENHQFPIDKINPFIPVLWPLPGEYWKEITEKEIPGILPYYAISNYGRIVHIFRNMLMSLSWDGPGYVIALLRTKDGTKTFRVHRLMMLVFRYRDDCNELVVDHINGDKKANYLDFPVFNPITNQYELQDNLRWVTKSENELYAYRDPKQNLVNNLRPHGNAVISKQTAIEICKLLEEGNLSFKQIADVLHVGLGVVQNIRYGKSWYEISCNYDFNKREISDKHLDLQKIHQVCKELELGKPMLEISKDLNVNISTIKGIKYRKFHTDISKDYNF